MCGIVGVWNRSGEPVSSAIVGRMADALAHRGPDGDGVHVDGALGLGHRRLSILDLSSAGSQPMHSPDGRYSMVYNGEIYNFRQLRHELEQCGRAFRSRSDSEVVLGAYAQWGSQCVERFNGMFALAVWDSRRHELFLARDRYGVKPLYYTFLGGTFLFASEIKSFREHPAFSTDLDPEALLEYFTFQNFFTDKTLFRGVHLLPAGCRATLSSQSGAWDITPRKYWDFSFVQPENPRSDGEYIEELTHLFDQAVRRQLVSDVEVGTYLSGGIDSGGVTSIAARQLPNIKSFTCGFDLHSASGLELSFDEREKAEHMSYLCGTEHYEMVLKAGDMERVLPRFAWHLEEPRVGQSYPNFYAAQLAGKFVKVVLAGTGGDELFGGYPWRYYRASVNHDFDDYVDKYYGYWQRLIPNRQIHKVFSPIWGDVQGVWTRDIFREVFPADLETPRTAEDYVNHSLYFEAKTFLHGLLLVDDKLSMAHGLETRVPFLDNDLVDFAMQLPVHMKLGNLAEVVRLNENEQGHKAEKYYHKTRDGKLILRKALGGIVPESVSTRAKQGFSAPDASWFKGESMEYVRRTILDPSARIYGFMDPGAVRSLVEEHLDGRVNRRLFIWSLLNFEWWIRNYLEGDASAAGVGIGKEMS